MSRPNYIAFVEALYRFDPNISDLKMRILVGAMFGSNFIATQMDWIPSDDTLSVWKARLRKKGVEIPDRRKTKKGE